MTRQLGRRKLFGLTGILAVFQLALLLSPTAQAAPDSITVGVIGDFSGPYAPVVGAVRAGAEDGWDYINNQLGGIEGVKVTPIIKDMGGKVDIGLSQYNEMVSMDPKPLFIDVHITPLSSALRERYVEDDVVGFHAGAAVSLYPASNAYGYYALYSEMLALGLKYLHDNWKESRPLKIGILTWDTSYGRGFMTDEFYAYAKELGVEIAKPQLYGVRQVDVLTQLMYLRSEKVDYIFNNTAAGGPLTVVKGIKDMGWDVPLVNSVGGGWGTVRLAPELFENSITILPTASFDEPDTPAMKAILEIFNAKNRTVNEKSIFYLLAWQNALVEYSIISKIVKEKGWDAVSTKAILEVLNNGAAFNPLNGLQKLEYSYERRTPRYSRVYEVKGGKLNPLTDFLEVVDLKPGD